MIELSKKFKTIGFDINKSKILELKKNIDRTGELKKSQVKNLKRLNFTTNSKILKKLMFL